MRPSRSPMNHLSAVRQAARRLDRATVRQSEARESLRLAVTQARANHTLEEIGRVLGVSKQAVHQWIREGNR